MFISNVVPAYKTIVQIRLIKVKLGCGPFIVRFSSRLVIERDIVIIFINFNISI